MPDRSLLSVILVLAFAVWGAILWALGIPLTWDLVKPYTFTLTALTGILALFDNFLWHWAPFRWFINRPDIRGTWKIEICSTYVDPETGKEIDPVDGFAVVHQTFSYLSLRLMTKNTSSFLIAHSFITDKDGTTEISGVYQSDPSIHDRGREREIHYGAFKVKIIGSPPKSIEGHYWNDRDNKGSITYSQRIKERADSYNDACALFPLPEEKCDSASIPDENSNI